MGNKTYKSWYTANGEEEGAVENSAQGTSSAPTPVDIQPAADTTQSIVEREFTPVQETLRDTDGNFNIFRLAPENDPNSAEFDPTLPESQVAGKPRRSSEEWDTYNKQLSASSGDMMAQGVVFGGGGGGGSTIINPIPTSSPKEACPVCKNTASSPSYKSVIPSFLAGALAFFLVNKYIIKK